jgi:hypothetical protein
MCAWLLFDLDEDQGLLRECCAGSLPESLRVFNEHQDVLRGRTDPGFLVNTNGAYWVPVHKLLGSLFRELVMFTADPVVCIKCCADANELRDCCKILVDKMETPTIFFNQQQHQLQPSPSPSPASVVDDDEDQLSYSSLESVDIGELGDFDCDEDETGSQFTFSILSSSDRDGDHGGCNFDEFLDGLDMDVGIPSPSPPSPPLLSRGRKRARVSIPISFVEEPDRKSKKKKKVKTVKSTASCTSIVKQLGQLAFDGYVEYLKSEYLTRCGDNLSEQSVKTYARCFKRFVKMELEYQVDPTKTDYSSKCDVTLARIKKYDNKDKIKNAYQRYIDYKCSILID